MVNILKEMLNALFSFELKLKTLKNASAISESNMLLFYSVTWCIY